MNQATHSKVLLLKRLNSDDFKIDEELLVKKRKFLEDKAPGLFGYLTRLSSEEVSTETASSHSGDHETDEVKHHIHIPTPFKTQNYQLKSSLSKTVRVNLQNHLSDSCHNVVGIKDEGFGDNYEEKQRQQMMVITTRISVMMNGLNSQTDGLTKIVGQCLEAIEHLKEELNGNQRSHLEKVEILKEEKKNSSHFDSNPTPVALFNHLFGVKNIYKYELVLDCGLPVPIFRERNLIIKAKLRDLISQKPVRNHNKVLVHLSLRTWEIPSNFILRNKTGNKAIMGETEAELKNGEVSFDRIQINEVTSKFIHGHVAMLLVPTKPANHGTSLSDHEQGEGYISYEQIKPLMIEKIIVKSKKKNPKKKTE